MLSLSWQIIGYLSVLSWQIAGYLSVLSWQIVGYLSVLSRQIAGYLSVLSWQIVDYLHGGYALETQYVRLFVRPKKLTKSLRKKVAKIGGAENARPGKCTTWKMVEWKIHDTENGRKIKKSI